MLLFMHREQNILESAFPAGVSMAAFLVHARADMLSVQLSKEWYYLMSLFFESTIWMAMA